MVRLFDSVFNLLKKLLERLLELYEPYWNWLVKHDKYVYAIMFISFVVFTFI